jgi:hypothetical protein
VSFRLLLHRGLERKAGTFLRAGLARSSPQPQNLEGTFSKIPGIHFL